ncbi:gastrotropin-like [Thalassophryne amazonica]|uniref:gastrotropin-like n=1 Tax=Thalassophryne amazonica TaxID=390379 RepID=UPI001471622E|nr:gastrotropin-like [Thalassophryne amazonica]
MDFNGKYLQESQENYEAFREAIGLPQSKTDHKVVTEVVQNGKTFTWTQLTPDWTWTNTFTVGEECELQTMTGIKFKAPVSMDNNVISAQFPTYHFSATIEGNKLVMICKTPGEKGVTFRRESKKI